MAGFIPTEFIDDLIGRVDIVDIIDRRVPLIRKGKEFMACCPFHEEKTPSFSVSPSKQFYHCFGCGVHGTAITFLMEYANLSFVEAIEQIADIVGLQVPRESSARPTAHPTAARPTALGDKPDDLHKMGDKAKKWFQQQLRNHADAPAAIAYLKGRGLDGETAATFALGFAADSWNDLSRALGTDAQSRRQLLKLGLVSSKDDKSYYDRFRGRVIFPIEDSRGRTVGFGGRIIGEGEPKYLNSPETSLFHKGAELYGLHRARRAMAKENKCIVVEGYMDVISLVQFGVENAVATLGTATTRVHLQRLFRLAPEVIFCFDGDRAGRDAAWKALQVALPEMQDGRQVGFLFLDDGEDPDSTVRSVGKDGFNARVMGAKSLPDFLFDHLAEQIDLGRMDGKIRFVSLVKPLLSRLPDGDWHNMMLSKLSAISGLRNDQLGVDRGEFQGATRTVRRPQNHRDTARLSPLAFATSLLLQHPWLVESLPDSAIIEKFADKGAEVLSSMVELCRADQAITTARLLESARQSPYYDYLARLAARPHFIDHNTFDRLVARDDLKQVFRDTLNQLVENQKQNKRLREVEKLRERNPSDLNAEEKSRLTAAMKERLESLSSDL